MGFFRDLAAQLKRLWATSTPAVRGMYSIALAACLAIVLAVGWWSSRPQYIALAHNLSPETASELVSRLDAAGIAHQLNFNGSVVLVPKNQFSKAKLQTTGLLNANQTPPDETGYSILSDPSDSEYRRKRNRESSLARAIEQMNAVESATVLIGQAEPSPFLIERKPSTASVMLSLRPGVPFGRSDAAAIARLVSSGVEGLPIEGVSVTDTNGQTWHGNGTDVAIDGHLEYQQRYEQRLAAAAMEHLTGLLGPGRAVVSVRAEMDFTQKKSIVTEFDPDGRVANSEITKIVENKGTPLAPLGVAGAASNVTGRGAAQSSSRALGSEMKTEEITKLYELGKKTDEVVEHPGRILQLSVAATIDIPKPEEGQPAILDKQMAEELIKRAVGFDDQRDAISVVVGPLPGAAGLSNDMLVLERWDFYTNLARSASLGIASLVALFLGLKTFRKFRDVVRPVHESPTVNADRLRVLSEFTQRAKENPDAMKAVISAWLNQPEGSQEGSGTRAKAA